MLSSLFNITYLSKVTLISLKYLLEDVFFAYFMKLNAQNEQQQKWKLFFLFYFNSFKSCHLSKCHSSNPKFLVKFVSCTPSPPPNFFPRVYLELCVILCYWAIYVDHNSPFLKVPWDQVNLGGDNTLHRKTITPKFRTDRQKCIIILGAG